MFGNFGSSSDATGADWRNQTQRLPFTSMPDKPISPAKHKVTRGAANEEIHSYFKTSDAPCVPEADLRCGGQGLRVYNTSHLPLQTCHAGCTQHCNVAASQRSLLTGVSRLPVTYNLSIRKPHLISIESCHPPLVKAVGFIPRCI
jgi:hypothetical protein